MLIEKDCVVGIHVRMFDLQKNLLEETEPQGVTYLHGHGDVFPKLSRERKRVTRLRFNLNPKKPLVITTMRPSV